MPPRARICKRGHDLELAYVRPDGFRDCSACRSIRFKKLRAESLKKPLLLEDVFEIEESFWSRVDRRSRGCWHWKKGKAKGYGIVRVGYRSMRSHVVAFILSRKRFPKGIICHKCDNKPCCKPKHVYDGTDQSNARDRVLRGRTARGSRNGQHRYPERTIRGESHPLAKLTDGDVEMIRSLYASGDVIQKEIADLFDVSKANIGCITRMETRVPFIPSKV